MLGDLHLQILLQNMSAACCERGSRNSNNRRAACHASQQQRNVMLIAGVLKFVHLVAFMKHSLF